ncbi:hypothetical protein FQR65_LT06566 [Abscondita terminalis]|nr:hypothetical protein FQR65_LT06566 [Abscondita terminalis]
MWNFIIFLTLILASFSDAITALKNITVSKCCELDEHISKNEGYVCVRGKIEEWAPRIYSPKKKTILPIPRNTVPSNWHLKTGQFPNCRGANATKVTNFIGFQNGSLWLVDLDGVLVHPQFYCIDYNIAFVCVNEVNSENSVAVRKCCGTNAYYKDKENRCININGTTNKINISKDKTIVAGFPTCDSHMEIAGKYDERSLQENGSLLLKETNVLLPPGEFCLEHVLESEFEDADPTPSIFTCRNYMPPTVTTIISKNAPSDLRFTLYPIGLALSAIFLVATLVAGSLLPASHHVLHWRCQTNHVICLLFGYILLCITQVAGRSMTPTPCFLMAVAMHFLFLAAFFWLNTMCFNIWWTFRDLRPQSLEKSQERCRLRIYEVYAWGFPLLIAATAAILDSIPSNSDYAFLRPKFGTSNCWFHGNLEILTYFYGPIGVLLLINLALFLMTARELTCGLWKRELVKSTSERAALGRVCMKLVVVMGVTWIADVVSFAVGGPQELWYLTDFINCLQGVLIFIVVGCQPQVLTAVKRWWCWRKRHTTGTAGTTNHHSSSSQGLPSIGDTVTNNSVTNNTKSVPMETSC